MRRYIFSATGHYSVIQTSYWMAYCILLSFSSLYLLAQGFSNTQIGLLLGLGSAAAALVQPLVGARADRLRRLSLAQFTALFVLAMVLGAAGLLLLPWKGAQGAVYILLLLLLQLLTPLTYSLGMACVNRHVPLNFGLARGLGGGAFALASAVCGLLAAAWGAAVIPIALLVTSLLLFLSTLTFRRAGTGPEVRLPPEALPQPSQGPFFKKYPRLLPLLGGVVLLCTSHNILMNFPYQIIRNLGGDSVDMGNLLTLQGLMDIPAMVCFSLLLKRAAAPFWVRLAGLSFFFHALLTWLAPGMPLLLSCQVFEMTGYALYTVASVYFVNDLVDLADRVQGQTYFTMANTIGIVLSSFLGGWLLDAAGTGGALGFATLTGAGGAAILWSRLKARRPVAVC